MRKIFLNKQQIIELLPHREPMLLIDEIHDIEKLSSAKAIVNVKKDSFFVQGHFPGNPVMPGVLIVEAFGQAAAALTAHGLDKETYDNKLVFLMGIEKARFRNPVIPDCKLELKIENTNNLLKLINPILAKYSTENEISIILQKKDLIIGKIELDITEEIITIINNEIKEFKIK